MMKQKIRTIQKVDLLFVVLCCCIFIGAMHTTLTILSLIIAGIVAILIGWSSQYKDFYCICRNIIVLLLFQNFFIGIGAHSFGNKSTFLMYLTQIPFMSICLIWGSLRIRYYKYFKKPLQNQARWFVGLLFIILLSMLTERGSLNSILINIRNLVVFYFVFEIGFLCLKDYEEICRLRSFIIFIACIFVFAGIILLVGGIKLYTIIGYEEVFIAKASPVAPGQLDGRFYTSLISKTYVRMGSILYEPITLTYFLAISFLIAVLYKDRNRFKQVLYSCFILLGLILTFGKGGYLIVLASFACLLCYKLMRFLQKTLAVSVTMILALLCIYLFSAWYFLNIGAAASNHFYGIINTAASVLRRPFGYGLGMGGNMSFIFNNTLIDVSAGFESMLMSFLYQLGIFGGIVFVVCVMLTSCSIKWIRETSPFEVLFVFMPFILLILSVMQDNTFTPQCITSFMLLQGAMKRICWDRKAEKAIELKLIKVAV